MTESSKEPVNLKDDELKAWCKHDCWTATEAIFLLHGKTPQNIADGNNELVTHFPQAKIYLNRSLQAGTIGKRKRVDGEEQWIDTPTAWLQWGNEKDFQIDIRMYKNLPGVIKDPQIIAGGPSKRDVQKLTLKERNKMIQEDMELLAKSKKEKGAYFTKRSLATQICNSGKFNSISEDTIVRNTKKTW